jgi:outer membrane receptor protein involved in Fe transport
VNVNGQYGSSNNFLIDGMDNNERFISSVIVKPSVEGIQEMKVQTNAYSAEMSRSAAGVINMITKSGSNEWHGSAFEFLRNEYLDAYGFFANRNLHKPLYRQHQFGGSIGGPIRKDKTSFFFDFERYYVKQGQVNTATVPTLAMRNGDFSAISAKIYDPLATPRVQFTNNTIPANRFDPVSKKLIDLYPAPQTSALTNNYVVSPSREQWDRTGDIRIDHRISDNNTFYGRYSANWVDTILPSTFPKPADKNTPFLGGGGTSNQLAQGIQLNDTQVFGSRLVMELKAGFSRMAIVSLPGNQGNKTADMVGMKNVNIDQGSDGLPNFGFSAGTTGFGDGNYQPEFTINNMYQGAGSLLYTRGSHNIKIGGEFKRRQVYMHQSQGSRGTLSFDNRHTSTAAAGGTGGNEVASFLLGYMYSIDRQRYLVFPGYRASEGGAYIQDDWRAANWLTLNFGVRYDVFTPLSEACNRISNIDLAAGKIIIAGQDGVSNTTNVPTDWVNFAPRIGFSAQLGSNTVLRGGYGTSFSPPFMGSPYAMRNPPFSELYNLQYTTSGIGRRVSDGLLSPTTTDPKNPTGTIQGVGLDMETQYVMQYNLTLQQRMPGEISVGVSYVGAIGRKLVDPSSELNVNGAVPGPELLQTKRIYYSKFPGAGNIWEHTNWGDSTYHALQVQVDRRFSGGLGIMANYTWAHAIDNFNTYRIEKDGPHQYLRNPQSDLRQRAAITANYQLPFGKKSGGVYGTIARGWAMNLVSQIQGGLPVNISNSGDRVNSTYTGQDHPNQVADWQLSKDQRTLDRYFNTSAFVAQTLYTYGNVGMNSARGPGRVGFDVSVHRTMRVSEKLSLQLRGEGFNVTNTPPFGNPNGSLGNSNFGKITTAGLPRNIQLAVKLIF